MRKMFVLSTPGGMKHFIMCRCPFFYSPLKMDTSTTTGKIVHPTGDSSVCNLDSPIATFPLKATVCLLGFSYER